MTANDADVEAGPELRGRARALLGIGAEPQPDVRRSWEWSVLPGAFGVSAIRGIPAVVVALLALPLAAGLGRTSDLVTSMAGGLVLGTGTGALLAPALAAGVARTGAEWGRLALVGTGLIGLGVVAAGLVSPVGGMLVAGLGVGVAAVGGGAAAVRGRRVQARVRDLALQHVGVHVGVVLAVAMIGGIAAGSDVPIGIVVLGLGVLVLLGAAAGADLFTASVRDRDLQRLRAAVAPDLDGDDDPTAEPFRRVWSVPTVRLLAVAYVGIGAAFVALHVHVVQFLAQEQGLGPWGRGTAYGAVALASIGAVRLSASADEVRFRQDPSRLAVATAAALTAAGVALWVAVVWPWQSRILLLVAGFALVAVAHVQADALMVAAVRPRLRAHATAVQLAMAMLVGGGLAAPLLGAVARRAQSGGALTATAMVLVVTGLATRRAAATAAADVDGALDDELETAQVAVLHSSGATLPLLACRNVNFSYGQVQVLFDVDFTVGEGEMVGLLGTNGAGKSTLLRVVSGLGTPSSGTVRHRGEDITYLDPAARVARGITQVPGGKAVFGPLSVVDNLRVHGHSLGRDKRSVEAGIERAFDAFPRLTERRNLPARVLSGGERQMLALSKALILEPRLLLIDELSLGLAPVVVGELIEMVRRINAQGTAVVLVEQSVNVALSLVDHAYYMEKGEVRFDGPAQDLLDRPDLLRSVYLQGAAEGLA